MKKLITICLLSTIFFSIKSQEFSVQQGGHGFTLDIPDYMTETFELNDAASLQYLNGAKEAYVVVIEDAKEHLQSVGTKFANAEEFLSYFLKDYQMESQNRIVGEPHSFNVNGIGHAQVEMSWDTDGLKLFILVTAVQTKEHFYKILCWTIFPNKGDLLADYQKIARSLKDS